MQDSMVTARMPQQKKEAGNRVLAKLGTNPSKAVNDLYDYVISKGELPFKQEEEFGLQKYSKEQLAQAKMFVESLKVELPADSPYRTMSIKEAKRERLAKKGRLTVQDKPQAQPREAAVAQ